MNAINFQSKISVSDYKRNSNRPSFSATPAQIYKKLESSNMCPGKKAVLEGLANFLGAVEKKMKTSKGNVPEKFDFFLTKNNEIPKDLGKIKVRIGFLRWKSFRGINKHISETEVYYRKDPESEYFKIPLRKLMFDFMKMLGVEHPEKVTISKK